MTVSISMTVPARLIIVLCCFAGLSLHAETQLKTTPSDPDARQATSPKLVDPNDGAALASAMRSDRLENFDNAVKYYYNHRNAKDASEQAVALSVLGETGAALLRLSRQLTRKATSADDPKVMKKAGAFEEEGLLYVMKAARATHGATAAHWWNVLAEHELALQDYGVAAQMLTRSLNASSLQAETYALRGRLNNEMKNYRDAADDFETAVEFERNASAKCLLRASAAEAYQMAREYKRADTLYQTIIKDDPNTFEWLVRRLQCLNAMNNVDAAKTLRAKILTRYASHDPKATRTQWQADNTWQCIDVFFFQNYLVKSYENLGATMLTLYPTPGTGELFHFLIKVTNDDGSTKMILVLESRPSKQNPDDREYDISMYRDNRRIPYGFTGNGLMGYQDLKKEMYDILNGVKQPVSVMSPKSGGPGERWQDLPAMNPGTITPEQYFKIIEEMRRKMAE